MANNSYPDYIQHWGQLDDRAKANPELAPFETVRAQLEVERLGLAEKMNQQAALKFQTQEVWTAGLIATKIVTNALVRRPPDWRSRPNPRLLHL